MIGAITDRLIGDAETVPEAVDTADGDGEGVPLPVGEDDIGLARRLVVDQLRAAENRFNVAWETDGDLHGSVAALTERHGWRTALAALERLERSDRADPERLDVQVDSRTIREAYDAVFREPEVESVVYLSGLAVADGVRTINRVLEFEQAEQTMVTAVADRDAQFAALDELEETGHQLLGHLHNHPGRGVGGTKPSDDDFAYQQDLEALGYDAIGLVVTHDGYLRAYSADRAFEITVHGDGITTYDRNQRIFRLRDV